MSEETPYTYKFYKSLQKTAVNAAALDLREEEKDPMLKVYFGAKSYVETLDIKDVGKGPFLLKLREIAYLHGKANLCY